MTKFIGWLGNALLLLCGSVPANAATCDGLRSVIEARSHTSGGMFNELLDALAAILFKHEPSKDECSSVQTVVARLFNDQKPGGKRLEDDKPLDVKEAQGQIAEAEHDTEVHSRMAELKSDTGDPKVQLLLDAVVLESEGFHAARELKIQQLRTQLK